MAFWEKTSIAGYEEENPSRSCSWILPDEIAGASSGCGLFGGRGESSLVLLAESIDGGVIVGCGGAAALGSRLIADRLQAGATRQTNK